MWLCCGRVESIIASTWGQRPRNKRLSCIGDSFLEHRSSRQKYSCRAISGQRRWLSSKGCYWLWKAETTATIKARWSSITTVVRRLSRPSSRQKRRHSLCLERRSHAGDSLVLASGCRRRILQAVAPGTCKQAAPALLGLCTRSHAIRAEWSVCDRLHVRGFCAPCC